MHVTEIKFIHSKKEKKKDADTGHPSFMCLNNILSEVEEMELLGISIRKKIPGHTLSRQDGQGCRISTWPPEKSLTLLEP